MGNQSVASMVVWEEGQHEKIRLPALQDSNVAGANDFASMHEVVTRRYGRTEELALPI